MRLVAGFVSLLFALLALLPGTGLAQAPGGEVVLAVTEEPDTLDPQKTATALTGLISRYFGDTLVTTDLNGRYIGLLAESWQVSPDGLTWTFKLRPGVKFHSGRRLTAAAAKASIERAIAPETKSPVAKSLFGPVAEVLAPDESTLVIKLSQPFSPFLDNLTDPRAMIIDVDAAKELGDQFGRSPVGTGPFRVVEWRSADRIILERNPDYTWGPAYTKGGPPLINRLVFRIIPEAATQTAAFEAGEVTVLTAVSPHDVKRFQESGRYQLFTFLRSGVGLFMEFNVEQPPFDDLLVRRALNYAVNKDAVVRIALEGYGIPAYGPLPPSIPGYWQGIEEYAPRYDPRRAKELLAQAGWVEEQGRLMKNGTPFKFTLMTAPIDTWLRSAQLIQAQLKSIGIEMDIQTYEFGTLLEIARAGKQQADLMGYTYTSPDILYVWFHSDNIGTGLANSHFRDERLDRLIEQSRREADMAKRQAIYAEIQRYIVDQALWVPIWVNYNYIAAQPQLRGAVVHPRGFLVLNDAYLAGR